MRWSLHSTYFYLLLVIPLFGGSSKPEPKSSCGEHFLNGQFRASVLPLNYDGEIYNVECVMPKSANNFPELLVETTVRNALEKAYDLLDERRTVGYQISNWGFLSDLVKNQQCEQDMNIDWRPLSIDGRSQGFAIESVLGQRREFVLTNHTNSVNKFVKLTSEEGQGPVGIVHLLPTGNSSFNARITLSALRCRQKVVNDIKCEFELNNAYDKVVVTTSNSNELSFSFRTDKPASGLLRLISKNGDATVRLEEGYLININGVPYPVRSLADGNFHSIKLNFKTRTMHIDGMYPAISFDLKFLKGAITTAEILINGTVTAIQLDGGDWLCGDKSRYLTVKSTSAPLRRYCPVGEASFCQCKAPSSVISGNAGLFNSEPKCSAPNLETGFTLKRDSSKLSFFYFPQTSIIQSVSVVFKSDARSGLIVFGQRKAATGIERYQVHYFDDTVAAGACLHDGSNQWTCKSCEIKRPGGVSSNDWIRVSLFNSSSYLFLTADDQICRLVQNDEYPSHNLYKGPETLAFLFVGGAYYKKLNPADSEARQDFKNDFYELTNLKPLPIRGCIAEIRVDGKPIDLVKQFNKQADYVLKDPSKKTALFGMTRGCDDCSLQCNGLPCRSQSKKQCDCSFGYAGLPTDDGKCMTEGTNALWLNSTVPMSLSLPIYPPHQKHVSKVWTLVRLPQVDGPVKLLDFARFHVLVDGKKVIIGSELYGIRKEFRVDSLDERLHLISIEQAPAMFESRKRFVFRVDSQVQEELLDKENSLENQFDVRITTSRTEASKFGGCIEGLYFALENDREQEGELDFVDVIKRFDAHNRTRYETSKLQIYRQSCGIIDPNLWREDVSSSPIGFVGAYDPYGQMQRIAGEEDGFSWAMLFLVIILILFFFIFACIVLIIKNGGKRTYVLAKQSAAVEETHPLYTEASPPNVKTYVGPDNDQKAPEVYNTAVVMQQQQQQKTPKSTNIAAALASKSDL